MKKVLLIYILSIFSYSTHPQITKISIEPIKNMVSEKIAVYDSTKNFLKEDVMLYIGQTLYVKGYKKIDEIKGYYEFYSYIPSDNDIGKEEDVYKAIKEGNRYISDYKYIKDHYFYIMDVLPGKDKKYPRDKEIFYLKVKNLANNDTLFFLYDSYFPHWPPQYLIVGYFEKLKQIYIGQTYEFYDPALVKAVDNDIYLSPDTVKYSGKRYSERNNTIWKCIDISIEDGNNYDIIAVLYNEKLGKAYAKIDEILPENYMNSRLWNCKTNEMNVSIYGQPTFDLIRQKRIRIGMKRDACLLSWGEPQDIIRSTDKNATTEQWTYKSGETLFFKNELLEKVQQQRTDK